ncbi:MAG: PRC-barrel domain-containing protein [Phycisphaeraceae bacterium]
MTPFFRGTAASITVALTFGSGAAALGALQPAEPREREAQQQQQQQPQHQQQQQEQQQQKSLLRVQDYIDMQVVNEQGDEVGEVVDIAIDVQQGRVGYAAIQPSDRLKEELQLDEELYALPFEALESDAQQQRLTLTVDEQRLAEAQGFSEDDWPNQIADRQWGTQQHEIFGFAPYWEEQQGQPGQQGQQQLTRTIEQAMTRAGVERQQAQQEAERLARQFQQEQPDRQQIQDEIEQALTDADVDQQQAEQEAERLAPQVEQQIKSQQGGQQPMQQGDQQSMQQPDPFAAPGQQQGGQQQELQVHSYEELVDMEVRDAQDEQLGTLSEFVIDRREGHVAYAIVSYGGFLGIGEELAPVPYESLQPQLEEDHFRLDATQEQLSEVAFTDDEWPNLDDQQWNQRIHETFDAEPYWEVHGYAAPGEEDTQQQQQQQQDSGMPEESERSESDLELDVEEDESQDEIDLQLEESEDTESPSY